MQKTLAVTKQLNKEFQETKHLFHQDEGFDFEKFYYDIQSFTEPIVAKGGVQITMMFLYPGENGRIYAQYRFSDEQKRIKKLGDETAFLEGYKLYMDEHRDRDFTIHKVFHNFSTLDPEDEEGFLREKFLETFFDPKMIGQAEKDFTKAEHTIKNFLNAENFLMGNLVEGYEPESCAFMPLPIVCRGDLVGIIYYIYDKKKSRAKNQEGLNLKQYFRLLILHATQAYETIWQYADFNLYTNKSKEPLKNYQEIFQDVGVDFYSFGSPPSSFRKIITANGFLMNLGYDDYYRRFARSLIQVNETLSKANNARVKSAIISIIVDSFAHNIGAHSLVALKWWFENRAKIAGKKFKFNKYPLTELGPSEINAELLAHFASKREFYSIFQGSHNSFDPKKVSLLDVIRFMPEELESNMLCFRNRTGQETIVRFPIPIAHSEYHFFNYLRDKSAFWSGVTRDAMFSGQVKSWIDLLREFLNNTLFLGTITHSEGINRIRVYLELIDAEGKIIEGGEYVEVNLEIIRKEKADEIEDALRPEPNPSSKEKTRVYSDYAFLREGENYSNLRSALEKLGGVFLPNGVIGQHALYTIWENTLRNIKHYKWKLKDIQKTGILFYISIQEQGFLKREKYEYGYTEEKKLFKVGAWLHHPQYLLNEEGVRVNEESEKFHQKGSIIHAHTQQLRQRIVNEFGQAQLGGSSQDKVCAAMLMNNSFLSIDLMDAKLVKRHYFPYIFASSEPYVEAEQRVKGFQLQDTFLHKIYRKDLANADPKKRRRAYKEAVIEHIEAAEAHPLGTIKKFFHLWKGESCKLTSIDFEQINENLSRFNIVAVNSQKGVPFEGDQDKNLQDEPQSALYRLRNQGITRVVEADEDILNMKDKARQADLAQEKWLGRWIGEAGQKIGLKIQKPGANEHEPLGVIYLQQEKGKQEVRKWKLTYLNRKQYNSTDQLPEEELAGFAKLNLAHGMDHQMRADYCRIRTHGSFMQDIYRDYDFDSDDPYGKPNMAKAKFPYLAKPAKLFETLLTHITIFDNRIHERLPKTQSLSINPFKDQLRLNIYPEDTNLFFKKRDQFLTQKGHFLIMHLSFLESIPVKKNINVTYKESQVKEFYHEELAKYYRQGISSSQSPLGDRFHLVIASGRGRGSWFEAVKHPQITFRPIEALVGAVEDGLMLKDDFQVKYNLCNVLFGS